MNIQNKYMGKFSLLACTLVVAAALFLPLDAEAAVDYSVSGTISGEGMFPEDVAISGDGRIYVSDGRSNQVLIYDAAGNLLGNFPVKMPVSIAVDYWNRIYVGTNASHSVRVFNPLGEELGFLGNGPEEFLLPRNIAVDLQNNIYVVDSQAQQIKIYDSSGSQTGVIDDAPNNPKDVTIVGDEIYVLDQPIIIDSYGGRILGARVQVFDLSGNPVRSFGSYGSEPGQFIRVKGITSDYQGRTYVSDAAFGTIECFDPDGSFLGKISTADMSGPRGIHMSHGGLLAVTSPFSGTVLMFAVEGAANPEDPPVNEPPVADAGNDQAVEEGTEVFLDGSGSRDKDDGIRSYLWRQVAGQTVMLSNISSVTPSFFAPLVDPGGATLRFELLVTDMSGQTSVPATCTVTVKNIVSGSIFINGRAQYCNSEQVSLTFISQDASLLRLSEDGRDYGEWQAYTTTASWQVSGGDGEKTVFVEYQDGGGNIGTASASIILDTVPPENPAVTDSGSSSANMTIVWTDVADGGFYRLQLADNPQFANSITIEPLHENIYTFADLGGGVWYWRVQAVDPAGNDSEWSMMAALRVGGGGICDAVPGAPVLKSPQYGDEVSASAAKLKIEAMDGGRPIPEKVLTMLSSFSRALIKSKSKKEQPAAEWLPQWQIALDEDFSNLVFNATISEENLKSLVVPALVLLPDSSYYWRARYWSAEGCSSSWSDVSYFDTAADYSDADGDGIPDEQEAGLTDLNEDSIPDGTQESIKTVRTSSGELIGIEVINPSGAAVEALSFEDAEALACEEGGPSLTDYGMVHFRISVPVAGESVEAKAIFTKALPEGVHWFKRDPYFGWLDYSSYAEISPDRKSITFIIVDGGLGDIDGAANRKSVDPAGPGFPCQGTVDGNKKTGQ